MELYVNFSYFLGWDLDSVTDYDDVMAEYIWNNALSYMSRPILRYIALTFTLQFIQNDQSQKFSTHTIHLL